MRVPAWREDEVHDLLCSSEAVMHDGVHQHWRSYARVIDNGSCSLPGSCMLPWLFFLLE